MYSCSLLELYPVSDSEQDTLNFGDGRGLCDREDSDLCLTTPSSIKSKSSMTRAFRKNTLQLTRDFVDSWRLFETSEIIRVERNTISLSWALSRSFAFCLRNAGCSKTG